MAHGWDQDALDALQTRRHPAQAPRGATIGPRDTPRGRQKFGAIRTTVDGHVFASKKEAARYQTLTLWQHVGAIRELECQPTYDLIAANGEVIGTFTPDFRYWSVELGRLVVEDVKGGSATKTEAYRLRKRLFTACHGITLSEI